MSQSNPPASAWMVYWHVKGYPDHLNYYPYSWTTENGDASPWPTMTALAALERFKLSYSNLVPVHIGTRQEWWAAGSPTSFKAIAAYLGSIEKHALSEEAGVTASSGVLSFPLFWHVGDNPPSHVPDPLIQAGSCTTIVAVSRAVHAGWHPARAESAAPKGPDNVVRLRPLPNAWGR